MRVLTISTDWNVFTEGSAVARRFRLQAQTVDRLDVIVPHGPAALIQLAGNAAARGFGLDKVAGFFRTLAAGLRINRPDVVSVQDPFLIGLLGLIIARMRGARFHVQVHTDLFNPGFVSHSMGNRMRSFLAWCILSQADSIRAVSERIRLSIEERGIAAPVSVLPVFIDEKAIQHASPLNRRSRYPQFEKLLLVVSRLEPEKDVQVAIRAMPNILERIPNAGLLIIGDGSQRKKLEALVSELELSEQVLFEGAKDPFPYYKIADAVLVTSRFEGYGMVIVESLVAECPVVSFDVGIAGEAGAIIATPETLASVTIEVLTARIRGRIAFSIPSEIEYRDLWRTQMATGRVPRDFSVMGSAQTHTDQPTIGFIGQGFIGKNYADDFENRGIPVVRYALEEAYRANRELIRTCDIVFIAVPTPTTPQGFDDSIVREALGLVGAGKTAVIKSTILPGLTEELQVAHPDIFVLHSPEFLVETTAAYDAAHPARNIVGIPKDTEAYRVRAETVLRQLPPASFELVCSSRESELIKYINNSFLYSKVIFVNLMYDLAMHLSADYPNVRDALAADPRVGRSHLDPIHQSGRGAGGHCFIKDFAALRALYGDTVPEDALGMRVLRALEEKNIELLIKSEKDLELLRGVYGADVTKHTV